MASSSPSQNEDIPASQVMPPRLRNACNERKNKIRELNQMWLHNKERQLSIQEAIKNKKQEIKMQRKEIKAAETEVLEIKENYEGLEDMINEKANWIIGVQEIFPYHNN